MTVIKIDAKPGAGAGFALERHAQSLYTRPGLNLVGVAIEAARLRVAVEHWAHQARRALSVEQITVAEMRHELDAVAAGLEAVLRGEAGEPA